VRPPTCWASAGQATLEDLLLVSVDDKLDEQTDRRRW
jgi:hypothetical protein